MSEERWPEWPRCPVHLFSQFTFSVPLRLGGKPSSMTFPEEDFTTEAQRHREGKQRSCSSGVPLGVSLRILSCNLKSPRAYAARLTTPVGNVKE